MKKYFLNIVLLFVMTNVCIGQNIDSLKHDLARATQDTCRIHILINLASYYKLNRPDSTLYYGNQARELARKIESPKDEIEAMYYEVISYRGLGNQAKALLIALDGIKIADENNLLNKKGPLLSQVGHLNSQSNNHLEAIRYFNESKSSYEKDKNYQMAAVEQSYVGLAWRRIGQLDSALHYAQLSYDNLLSFNASAERLTERLIILGEIHWKMGNTSLAAKYYKNSVRKSSTSSRFLKALSSRSLARYYQQMDKLDSAAHYAHVSLENAKEGALINSIIRATALLSDIYVKVDLEKSLEYSNMSSAYKDSLLNLSRSNALTRVYDFEKQERQFELDTAKAEYQNRLRLNIFLGSTFSLLIIAFFLYRNSKQKQKAKQKIELAYDQLKSTQTQLIQSEKMASLGELTAGIAHEIQNPLNFVNNFSEVNGEMLEELKEEIEKGNSEEAKAIAEDLIDNESKIKHHGLRADSIVKGMLMHSRAGSGEKELTDINALADEYLRSGLPRDAGERQIIQCRIQNTL